MAKDVLKPGDAKFERIKDAVKAYNRLSSWGGDPKANREEAAEKCKRRGSLMLKAYALVWLLFFGLLAASFWATKTSS